MATSQKGDAQFNKAEPTFKFSPVPFLGLCSCFVASKREEGSLLEADMLTHKYPRSNPIEIQLLIQQTCCTRPTSAVKTGFECVLSMMTCTIILHEDIARLKKLYDKYIYK